MSSMNKRQLRHFWVRFRRIKPWYFLIAALICGSVAVLALRSNSEHMADLRQQVFIADKNNGDVQGALKDLQNYVIHHMNTSLSSSANVYPPIQLQYTYERLVVAAGSSQQANNGDLYTEAENYCQAQIPTGFSGRGRVPCITQYVKDHGSTTNIAATIPASLYEFDFVAPRWSPDLAGWMLVLAVLSGVLTVIVFFLDWRIKRALK